MPARPAAVDDAEELLRLAERLFESMGHDASGPQWKRTGIRLVTERLGRDLNAFVVDHPDRPGRLIASAAGTFSTRLPTPMNPSGQAGYVQWVCVDDEFRRRGLGRQVVASLLEWFDGLGVGTVELHATPMAEALYAGLGFDRSGPKAMRRKRW